MADNKETINEQKPMNELERILLFPDSDLESIATMPIEDIEAELRQIGLDPNEPLHGSITRLISRKQARFTLYDNARVLMSDPLIRVLVIGVGGGGSNALNRMIEAGIKGAEFATINTDLQALNLSRASIKIQLGETLTKGLGTGGDPAVGWQAALGEAEPLVEVLEGVDLVFLTAGLGGGTGTGAAPIIAGLARELGALTIAVVTEPFSFEGKRRKLIAETGLLKLREGADTVITIPNNQLLQVLDHDMSLADSFKVADDVLRQAVHGISELITTPGVINLDFADVKMVMRDAGLAWLGIGSGSGESRAIKAAKRAVSSPLLGEAVIDGAKNVLINITGGNDLTLFDVSEASSVICSEVDEEANIIIGTVVDETMNDEIKVTLIATGFDERHSSATSPIEASKNALTVTPQSYLPQYAGYYLAASAESKPVEDTEQPVIVRRRAR